MFMISYIKLFIESHYIIFSIQVHNISHLRKCKCPSNVLINNYTELDINTVFDVNI